MRREIELFAKDLSRNPNVLGVAVFGSAARGDWRPDSDVDLFVLTDGLDRRKVEKIGDLNFELVYSSDEGAYAFAKSRMDSFLNLWKDAKILNDKNGGLARLRDFALENERSGKPAIPDWKREHTEFDIRDSIRAAAAIRDTDPSTAEMYLHRTVFNLLQFYFDDHSVWTPPPKKQLKWLREQDAEVAQKFDAFYKAQTFDEKMKAASELVDHMFRSGMKT
jgi:predicted nucleotidyltransferase